MNSERLQKVIEALRLEPLEGEGGLWTQSYISREMVQDGQYEGRMGDRALCGTIYYLLTPTSFSSMHRLSGDEIWYYHDGPALKILLIDENGRDRVVYLGKEIEKGQRPQLTIPKGTWQGCCMAEAGEYTLVSTSMAPMYKQSDFTLGHYEELLSQVSPANQDLLKKLTGEIRYQ